MSNAWPRSAISLETRCQKPHSRTGEWQEQRYSSGRPSSLACGAIPSSPIVAICGCVPSRNVNRVEPE